MIRRAAILAGACCLAVSGLASGRAQNTAQSANPTITQQPAPQPRAERIPAYHKEPPKGPLPKTLDPKMFPDPLTRNVYAIAAKEKKILYQLPCYCGCDREAVHHTSLLDCYCDNHASFCATCRMEAVFAYQEYRKGKTATQIREDIIAGKWRDIDLSPYSGNAKTK
ncbi:MAG TPA: CYCXC family (seleno)protein [Candidatus Acidoferrum sp.]|nr:CYCXC family (seleno)protein [Candidatus Acidoferrum sp.]